MSQCRIVINTFSIKQHLCNCGIFKPTETINISLFQKQTNKCCNMRQIKTDIKSLRHVCSLSLCTGTKFASNRHLLYEHKHTSMRMVEFSYRLTPVFADLSIVALCPYQLLCYNKASGSFHMLHALLILRRQHGPKLRACGYHIPLPAP